MKEDGDIKRSFTPQYPALYEFNIRGVDEKLKPRETYGVIVLLHESEVIGLRSMLKRWILVSHQRDYFILNTHRMINIQLTHNGGKYALLPQHIHGKICSTLNTCVEKETMANWRRDVFCITPVMIHRDDNAHSGHRRRRQD